MEGKLVLSYKSVNNLRKAVDVLNIRKNTLTQDSASLFPRTTVSSQTSVPSVEPLTDALKNRLIDQPLSENDIVNPEFLNRNPRNLENICVARKPKGWALDIPPRNYWHKFVVLVILSFSTAFFILLPYSAALLYLGYSLKSVSGILLPGSNIIRAPK